MDGGGGQHVRIYLERYKKFLAEKGLEYRPELILYGNYDARESRRVVREFLSEGPDITAVCCGSDLMASCALVSIKEAGLSVPEDISIIGLDNNLYSRLALPRITSVELNIYEAGQEAGRILLDQIESPGDLCSIQMDQYIVEGDSVRTIDRKES